VLTEFSAIATWIARQAPDRRLLPEDPDSEARSVEVMAYVEGTIHGQGYARLFVPEQFDAYDETRSTLGSALDDVKRNGREIVERGFGLLDTALAANAYAAGERFTIADAALSTSNAGHQTKASNCRHALRVTTSRCSRGQRWTTSETCGARPDWSAYAQRVALTCFYTVPYVIQSV
jgi:glutathione S-transferase